MSRRRVVRQKVERRKAGRIFGRATTRIPACRHAWVKSFPRWDKQFLQGSDCEKNTQGKTTSANKQELLLQIQDFADTGPTFANKSALARQKCSRQNRKAQQVFSDPAKHVLPICRIRSCPVVAAKSPSPSPRTSPQISRARPQPKSWPLLPGSASVRSTAESAEPS